MPGAKDSDLSPAFLDKRIALAGGIVLVLFVLLVGKFLKEPNYQGKNASEWAEILIVPQASDYSDFKTARTAFKTMGDGAITLLIDRLEDNTSDRVLGWQHRIKTWFGYQGKFYTRKERKLLYIEALGSLGTNAVIATPVLVKTIDDPDKEIAQQAAEAVEETLGHMDLVVPKMISLLNSREADLMKTAINILRHYPAAKPRALPLLEQKLTGPDYATILFASRSIKDLAPEQFENIAVRQLTNNFSSPDPVVITASLQALDGYHPPSPAVIDATAPLLTHASPEIRGKTIRHLAEWVNDDASGRHRRTGMLDVCVAMLDDTVEEVRLSAAHALMSWGPDARKAMTKLDWLQRRTNGAHGEYRRVMFRLDPDYAFELQKNPHKP